MLQLIDTYVCCNIQLFDWKKIWEGPEQIDMKTKDDRLMKETEATTNHTRPTHYSVHREATSITILSTISHNRHNAIKVW